MWQKPNFLNKGQKRPQTTSSLQHYAAIQWRQLTIKVLGTTQNFDSQLLDPRVLL